VHGCQFLLLVSETVLVSTL